MAVKQVVDIVGELVAQLGFTIVITNNVDNGGGNHILSMDNTYYLTNKKKVDIGGNQYKVDSFVFNESITVSPINHVLPIVVSTFDLPAPKYFHGTVRTTDPEVAQTIQRNSDTRPFFYLFEPIRVTTDTNFRLDRPRKAPMKMFLISLTKYDDKLNNDFTELEIKPLSNIECKLLEIIPKQKGLDKLRENFTSTNHPRFATHDKHGEIDLIFSQEFSAIELDITLEIRKC